MLEDVYVDAATLRRFRSCVLGSHVERFCAWLQERGYDGMTVRLKMSILGRFDGWVRESQIAVGDLDERRALEFITSHRREGWGYRGAEYTVVQFVGFLRRAGVVAACAQPRDDSPTGLLLGRFDTYLRDERGLAPCTISSYRFVVRPFVARYFADAADSPAAVRAGQVRSFLLDRTRGVPPRRAQTVASAMRSFLRFLFLRGETPIDLAHAIPTVRQGRGAAMPRHLALHEVERVLRACDLSSHTGRRDHAILLLCARLGLRAGEVLALELDDVRWREGEIRVRGKGLLRDRLPLPRDVGEAIASYLRKDRRAAECRRLFLCTKAPQRGSSHVSSVSTIVHRAFVRAGLDPAPGGAHVLRHSLATAMIRRGASMTEIGEVLRHRSGATTEIYAKLDFSALREVALPWPVAGGGR